MKYDKKKKRSKRETANTNIRIYPSTLEVIRPIALQEGKSIPRIIDEKFAPQKYAPKTE